MSRRKPPGTAQAIQHGGLPIGAYGLPRPPALVPLATAQIAVLRVLGRLEFLLTPHLALLVYGRVSQRTVWRQLKQLVELGFVWREAINLVPGHRHGAAPTGLITGDRQRVTPLHQPFVYGLTPEGLAYLQDVDAEADPGIYDHLHIRDRRNTRVPLATLVHDLQASWWCSSIIADFRRSRLCAGISAHVEYISHERRRVDALVKLHLNPHGAVPLPGPIPWNDGVPRRPEERDILLALEVDRGTETLKLLLGKAVCYRDLTREGHYRTTLGGDVIPVFLTPTVRRAAQIAREFQDGWPDGPGVATTADNADHAEHGPLWGRYRRMRDGQETQLLPVTLAQWQASLRPAALPDAVDTA